MSVKFVRDNEPPSEGPSMILAVVVILLIAAVGGVAGCWLYGWLIG